jgi:hypothetical protein
MYQYGPKGRDGASIWVSGPIAGTWYATVKFRSQEKDLDARSLDGVLGAAKKWVDDAPELRSRRRRSYGNAVGMFVAVEFDLARGKRTGRQMEFDAADLSEAAKKLAYTLNLSSAGWRVSPSGRTVGRKTGDIGWHLVKAGSPGARNMGL